jgi:hypothetical protein
MRERPCRIVACSEQKASGRAETSRGCAQSRTAFLYDTLLVPVSITFTRMAGGLLDRGCTPGEHRVRPGMHLVPH